MKSFGERLKELRGEKSLSQEGLARAAGVSVSTVSKLEQLNMDPSWSTVMQLAKALGVSCEAFAECVGQDDAKAEAPASTPPAKPGRPRKEPAAEPPPEPPPTKKPAARPKGKKDGGTSKGRQGK